MAEIQSQKSAKRERTLIYSKGCIVVRGIFNTFLPVTYHNPTGMDREGPYMLLANHQSWMDPVIIAVGCRAHEIRFVGKKEITKNKALAWLVKQLHMITVDRHNTDMQAMRLCNQVLKDGKVLGIFPEGTRHLPDLMSEVETGAAVLAMRAKVPVLPVYITGKLRLFRRIHVYVGQPMDYQDLLEEGMNTDTLQKFCNRVRETFHGMRKAHLDSKKK